MMKNTFRVVDAVLNRAMEGVRTAEDFLRFHYDRHDLATELKDLRHRLLAHWSPFPLLANRAVERDAMKFSDHKKESHRSDEENIVHAALHRAMESVRTLEESAKLLDNDAALMQQLRFTLYDIEQRWKLSSKRSKVAESMRHRLYAILDDTMAHQRDLRHSVDEMLQGGAGILQLRVKSIADSGFLSLARYMAERCREVGAVSIINDRPDIALLSGASGVHLGQDDITPSEARDLLGDECIVGISTHTEEEVDGALDEPVDYIACGAIYGTANKGNEVLASAGTGLLEYARSRTATPIAAIGGVNPDTIPDVINHGADIPVVMGWLYGDSIKARTEQAVTALEAAVSSFVQG